MFDGRVRDVVAAVVEVGIGVREAGEIGDEGSGVVEVGAVGFDGVIAAFVVVVADGEEDGGAGGVLFELEGDEGDGFADEGVEGCVVVEGGDGVELFAEVVDEEVAGDEGEGGVGISLGGGGEGGGEEMPVGVAAIGGEGGRGMGGKDLGPVGGFGGSEFIDEGAVREGVEVDIRKPEEVGGMGGGCGERQEKKNE